jgi:hypothetical protein
MATIGQGISLRGITHEDFHYPFNCANTMTIADVGKPVALDTTAARTVKIAGNDDVVLGVLVSFEDRVVEGVKVGTVALKGGFKLTGVSGHTIAVGGTVVGSATAGQVKAAASPNHAQNMVVAVTGNDIEVVLK